MSDLSALMRTSLTLYIQQAQELNANAVLRLVGEPRPEGDAMVVPFEDTKSGSRFEVLCWPDGSVNGLREIA